MSASSDNLRGAEPNLTPILDMVFQLITFFMLVINFKAASVDAKLDLPVIGSAQPSDVEAQDVIVLNIDKEGRLHVYGQLRNVSEYVQSEAQAEIKTAKAMGMNLAIGSELPGTVVIRADKATPFRLLNEVIKVCQANGFRKYQYRAMSGPAEKK